MMCIKAAGMGWPVVGGSWKEEVEAEENKNTKLKSSSYLCPRLWVTPSGEGCQCEALPLFTLIEGRPA